MFSVVGMKTQLKKLDKKTEELFKASSVAVLLEHLNDTMQVIAEGQVTLREEMRREISGLRNEMKTDIFGLRGEMTEEIGSLRDEMKSEVGGLRSEMK